MWSDESRFSLYQNDGRARVKREPQEVMAQIARYPINGFLFPNGNGIFQNDNSNFHRALIIQNWFREPEDSFPHMYWPPQSPDLHPIENLWDILEHRLRVARFSRCQFSVSVKNCCKSVRQ
ncbi:hypothetical protein AVEN_257439-1 [Araneus ventricosus]|uniref:Tc1-like transposase DDE domain-containing protein n=1 Tax=Araneus ventricosus TaxID=182803 RepID=A0A4Y2FEI9_ARAVE|nr:hypothetical protein AVEN_257439-1 [Araneus ventricosus]